MVSRVRLLLARLPSSLLPSSASVVKTTGAAEGNSGGRWVGEPGQRQKVNAISAVSAKGGFWSQVYTGMFNAGRFVEFLKAFRRGGRGKVFLVVDGHPSHRAKVVAAYVAACRGELELHFPFGRLRAEWLPPYAPDLNPDEFVWQYAKTNGVAKKPLRRNESLKERVTQDLANIKANPHLIRSFLMGQSVVYARD